jgi:hypothetical protein
MHKTLAKFGHAFYNNYPQNDNYRKETFYPVIRDNTKKKRRMGKYKNRKG